MYYVNMSETGENPYPDTMPPEDSMLGKAFDATRGDDLHAVKAAQDMFDEKQGLVRQIEVDDKSNLATEKKWRKDLENTAENLDENEQLLVMVGDVNGFKPVNDKLGHDAGDKLLGLIGDSFRETFRRESDSMARGSRDNTTSEDGSLARLGGDEFSVFIRSSEEDFDGQKRKMNSEETVQMQSERLNRKLKEILKGTEFEEFNVSIALGGVEYDPEIDRSPMDTFVRADAAMFETKYKGKIENLSERDIIKLRKIIPYLEEIGTRVESWLKEAVFKDSEDLALAE